MNGWLVRGVGMGLVHVVARVILAYLVSSYPLEGSTLRTITLLTVIAFAAVWGGVDGLRDRRANPDPDDSADLTMLWLKGSVTAGLGAGAVTWIVSVFSPVPITSNSIFFEITSGAAFTILLVFVPALLAVALGRLIAGREQKKAGQQIPVRRRTQRREVAEPDTEVFAAVKRDPDTSAGAGEPGAWTEPEPRR